MYTVVSVLNYIRGRFTSLVPPLVLPENPIKLLRLLNRQQAAFFMVAILAWTFDAFDFFTVALNVKELAKSFGKSQADITWGITATLMLRSVGAIVFGVAGDRYGRKWPFIVNIIFYSTVEIITGFCQNYTQFIAIRALFGVAMGGIYGNCAATALEDAPTAARGLLSGLLQQGYSLGYLLAAALNLAITPNQSYGWRPLFWLGGVCPLLIAAWRAYLPETQSFLKVKEARENAAKEQTGEHNVSAVRAFFDSVGPAIRQYWGTLLYLIFMMAGFNFLSHGSQDLYPTFLSSQLHFTDAEVTITTVVSSIGALIGGTVIGYFSNFFGRRLSMIVILIIGALLIPAYLFPRDMSIMAGAFFEQMCVQGAWGVVPIHLMELSPPQFRSVVVGASYQLGNLISSPSSTIEAKVGSYFPLDEHHANKTTSSHHPVFDYGKVMAMFLAITYSYLLIIILFGPEKTNTTAVTEKDTKANEEKTEKTEKKPAP